MRDSEGHDAQRADLQRRSGAQGVAELFGRRVAQLAPGAARRVHAHSELAGEDAGAARVVAMLVGEKDVGHVAERDARMRAAAGRLTQGQAGVDQNARSAGLDPQAIARAAAGEHAEAH